MLVLDRNRARTDAVSALNEDRAMRIHHLSCGTMCPYGGRLGDGVSPTAAPATIVCHCLLIETRAMHPWITDYNHSRPHSALGGKSPAIHLNNVLGFDT